MRRNLKLVGIPRRGPRGGKSKAVPFEPHLSRVLKWGRDKFIKCGEPPIADARMQEAVWSCQVSLALLQLATIYSPCSFEFLQ
jgi:hypothetical protein